MIVWSTVRCGETQGKAAIADQFGWSNERFHEVEGVRLEKFGFVWIEFVESGNVSYFSTSFIIVK